MGVPSVSASSSVNSDHSYFEEVSETPQAVFGGRGNLYGFFVENNGATDIYIQFFDAANAITVTPGVTVPDFTFKIPASSSFGKDTNDSPLHFFSKGCVVAVTAARSDGSAPVAPATCQFWHYNSKY